MIGFVVHFVIYYNFTNEISTVLSTIDSYQNQGENIMDIYSGFSELTNKIEHFNEFDAIKLGTLRKRISYLTSNRMNFQFNADTNKFIDTIFYENSCQADFSINAFKG